MIELEVSNDLMVAIVSPSGGGKSHIAKMLFRENVVTLPSYTTRLPRYRGEEGHTFVDPSQFIFEDGEVYEFDAFNESDHRGKRRNVIAYTYFDGEHYWAEREQFEGKGEITYIVDPAGAICLKKTINPENLLIVYLANIPEETLYERMVDDRGRKHAEQRLKNDKAMFQYCPADVVIDGRLTDKEIYDYINLAIGQKLEGKI